MQEKMIKREFGKLKIMAGRRGDVIIGKPATCPFCQKKIKPLDVTTCIKGFGETHKEFHYECMLKICDFFYDHTGWADELRGQNGAKDAANH